VRDHQPDPYVRALEETNLSTARDKRKLVQLRPQLEYPWEDPATSAIRWPARHLPIASCTRHSDDLSAERLIRLAQKPVNQ